MTQNQMVIRNLMLIHVHYSITSMYSPTIQILLSTCTYVHVHSSIFITVCHTRSSLLTPIREVIVNLCPPHENSPLVILRDLFGASFKGFRHCWEIFLCSRLWKLGSFAVGKEYISNLGKVRKVKLYGVPGSTHSVLGWGFEQNENLYGRWVHIF